MCEELEHSVVLLAVTMLTAELVCEVTASAAVPKVFDLVVQDSRFTAGGLIHFAMTAYQISAITGLVVYAILGAVKLSAGSSDSLLVIFALTQVK